MLLVAFLGGCVFFGVSTVLGALLIPLAYLVILLLLLARSFSPSKAARVVSAGVLLALVASAIYAVSQVRAQGPAWQLSRPQGSAHGGSFAQRWAEDLPVPLEQLMRFAVSGSERERTNATDVLKERARQSPSLEALETELRVLLSLSDLTEAHREKARELAALLREVHNLEPKDDDQSHEDGAKSRANSPSEPPQDRQTRLRESIPRAQKALQEKGIDTTGLDFQADYPRPDDTQEVIVTATPSSAALIEKGTRTQRVRLRFANPAVPTR